MEAKPVTKYYWPLTDDLLLVCRGSLWFLRYMNHAIDKLEQTDGSVEDYLKHHCYNRVPDAFLLLRGVETTLHTADGKVYEFTDQ